MIYTLLSFLVITIALAIAYWCCRLLYKGQWFLGWLKGTSGLLLFLCALFLGFCAFDISSYKQLTAEQKIASIRFKKIDHQHYLAAFTINGGETKEYDLYGDQWQLDSRVIKWSNYAVRFGMKTGYRLDRLAGRYLSLNDERNKTRKVYSINESPAGIDSWLWLNNVDDFISFIDARYGSGVFLPMSDNGFYQISLTNSGLIARPLNQAAKEAVELWQ